MAGTDTKMEMEMKMNSVLRIVENLQREVREIEAGLEGMSQKDNATKCKKIYSEFGVKNAWNNDLRLLPLSTLRHLLSKYGWEEGEKTKKERKCIKRCIERMTEFMFERNVTMARYQKKTNDALQLLDDYALVDLIDATGASQCSELRYRMEHAMNAMKNCEHDIYSFIATLAQWGIVKKEIRKKTSYAREALLKLEQFPV